MRSQEERDEQTVLIARILALAAIAFLVVVGGGALLANLLG